MNINKQINEWAQIVERQEAEENGTFFYNCVHRNRYPKLTTKEIKYFHPTGKQMPNGSHFSRGGFLHECAINEKAFEYDESVHGEQYGLAKYRGGLIIFSTDINAVKLSKNAIVNKIKQFIATLNQRLTAGKKVHKTIFKYNQSNEEYIGAYSLGNFFKGNYIDDSGNRYSEKSLCLEVNGISSKTLLKLAEMLCEEFKQETVLVKDLNKNKIYVADAVPGDIEELDKINQNC